MTRRAFPLHSNACMKRFGCASTLAAADWRRSGGQVSIARTLMANESSLRQASRVISHSLPTLLRHADFQTRVSIGYKNATSALAVREGHSEGRRGGSGLL